MTIKQLGIEFAAAFTIALVTAAIVTFLWNLIGHGEIAVDWETSTLFAIIFGVLLARMKWRETNTKQGI